MRRILYVTGTRADFGLMQRTLSAIDAAADLSLGLVVTGMHLSPLYGDTMREVEESGLAIVARVPVAMAPATGATMARGIATMLAKFTTIFETERPDIVLLLGDRGEMLAGAIAALHLNIAIAHLHGGERSGTVDESVRHAVSKLSHIHLTATEEARERLIRLGEAPANIRVTGAPGLDGLVEVERISHAELAAKYGFDPARPIALLIYHPVLQGADSAGEEAGTVLDAVLATKAQALVLMPNADAGSQAIRQALEARGNRPEVALVVHLARADFVRAMASVDVMVGNSSAGIIEAASFGTPVVNIGSRQNLRERNSNIVDVPIDAIAIETAVGQAIAHGRLAAANVYGDGQAAEHIVAALRAAPLGPQLMAKANAH